jgi:hypothetical protein
MNPLAVVVEVRTEIVGAHQEVTIEAKLVSIKSSFCTAEVVGVVVVAVVVAVELVTAT